MTLVTGESALATGSVTGVAVLPASPTAVTAFVVGAIAVAADLVIGAAASTTDFVTDDVTSRGVEATTAVAGATGGGATGAPVVVLAPAVVAASASADATEDPPDGTGAVVTVPDGAIGLGAGSVGTRVAVAAPATGVGAAPAAPTPPAVDVAAGGTEDPALDTARLVAGATARSVPSEVDGQAAYAREHERSNREPEGARAVRCRSRAPPGRPRLTPPGQP